MSERITIRFTRADITFLETEAARRQRPVAELVRDAVRAMADGQTQTDQFKTSISGLDQRLTEIEKALRSDIDKLANLILRQGQKS